MAQISLKRPTPPRALISLVPMIDVMLILLVFFMVTSTYLDLDMVPAVKQSDQGAAATAGPAPVFLVRIGADGQPVLRGQTIDLQTLGGEVSARLADAPLTQVVLLPSGSADMQALISIMDRITQAGATRLRVIRLEARQ